MITAVICLIAGAFARPYIDKAVAKVKAIKAKFAKKAKPQVIVRP